MGGFETVTTLAKGTLLGGRYEVIAPCGSGAYATVYQAEDRQLGEEVALKVLDNRIAAGELAIAQLVKETRIARKLSHPNIVRVYTLEHVDGLTFIVMEYVDGRTLLQLLAEAVRAGRDYLGAEDCREIAGQLCEALRYAHEQQVLHRDIKPGNALKTADGLIKITDFGIARVMTDASTLSKVVSSGTPPYMSPEQLRGSRGLDQRTDIYSLAATLYHLATGVPPFSEPDVFQKILHLEPQPIAAFRSDLPAGLESAITAGLSKDPAGRPSSVSEFRSMVNGAGPEEAPEPVRPIAPRTGLRPAPAPAAGAGIEREKEESLREEAREESLNKLLGNDEGFIRSAAGVFRNYGRRVVWLLKGDLSDMAKVLLLVPFCYFLFVVLIFELVLAFIGWPFHTLTLALRRFKEYWFKPRGEAEMVILIGAALPVHVFALAGFSVMLALEITMKVMSNTLQLTVFFVRLPFLLLSYIFKDTRSLLTRKNDVE